MIRKLCETWTTLSNEDIERLENITEVLPVIADLVKADVFIDCLTRDSNTAIVVSEAKPCTGKSLYKYSVVGQLALRENEPAALRTLELGMETRDLKAITQENKMVRQNVVPIRNSSDKIIGVLIMEQDVTNDMNKNTQVDILSETAEQLTQTLMSLREGENEDAVTYHSNDAIIMFEEGGKAAFSNPAAEALYKKLGYRDNIIGMSFDNLCLDQIDYKELVLQNRFSISEIEIGKLSLQVKYAAIKKKEGTIGVVMLIKDMTEVKEKEKELILKSVAIREIHHRVKNNLQTIASLLRLQSRRIEDEQSKKFFNDSISRVLSIAVTHEILAQKGVDDVDIKTILNKIKENTVRYGLSSGKNIGVEVLGDSFNVNSDKATSIALVVNELLQNALDHAFNEKTEGKVEIIIQKGIMYSNVSLVDNGDGFDLKEIKSGSLGLNIVKGIVKDRLNGNFNIKSSANGTKIVFDFEN